MFTDYSKYEIKEKSNKIIATYTIQKGDELSIQLFTRKGSKLIENTQTPNTQQRVPQSFLVDIEGYVEIPILGKLYVLEKTEKELETILENNLKKLYKSPFVIAKVTNRRAFVFIGETSFLVELNRSPTNIFEVISKTGNFNRHISVSDILIYRHNDSSTAQKIDLSTIDGIINSNIIVEPNDIVYIPEKNRGVYHAVRDISPVVTLPLSIITSTVSMIVLILSLSK